MMYTIYSKEDCSFCRKAKQLLTEKGISFEEVNIDEDFDALEWFALQGFKTVPQIFCGNDSASHRIGGYTDLIQFFSDVELQQNK